MYACAVHKWAPSLKLLVSLFIIVLNQKEKKKGRKQFYTVLTEVKEKVQAQGSVKDGSGGMRVLKAFFAFFFHFA